MRVQWKSLALGLVPHGCEDFSTVEKIVKPLCMIFIKYSSPQREEWIAHHIYFLFYSTGKCVSSVVSRALSVFVLNRFSSDLRYGQNSDILQYSFNECAGVNVSQRANNSALL